MIKLIIVSDLVGGLLLMIKTNLFESSESRKITEKKGLFSVIEYERDMSVLPEEAEQSYFYSKMNIKKRQLLCSLGEDVGVITQSGSMQMMLGPISAQTDVHSAGGLVKKIIGGKVTGESAIKPKYTGEGTLILEPTLKYIILEDVSEWNGSFMVEDGMFLACEDTVNLSVRARENLSSAVLGSEGIFNTCFSGTGIVALESPVPRCELVEIYLEDDVVKVDGDMAVAWSENLQFTVERTTKTLIGSMVAGEGLVNTYRGTGKILVATVRKSMGKNAQVGKE